MVATLLPARHPDYCHCVNTLGTGTGTPGGSAGRDPPDQARLAQLAEEQAALRRVATLVASATPPGRMFAAVAEEVGTLQVTSPTRGGTTLLIEIPL